MKSGIFIIGSNGAYGIPSWECEQRRKAKHTKRKKKKKAFNFDPCI